MIERAAFGGQAAGTEKLDNMPGFPEGVEGFDFAQRLRKQAERFGVELLQAQEVRGVAKKNNLLFVAAGGRGFYFYRALPKYGLSQKQRHPA